ncbi:MAG: hypothetical protein JKY68_08775, partial [Rhodospirillales bacterium]|nr:hypothetical protein [Rhodospirillales bacterium]
TINEKISRAFATESVEIDDSTKQEENFQIYSVGEIQDDFVEDLKLEDNPGAYAPYVRYLHLIGRTVEARNILTIVGDTIAAGSEATPDREMLSPAEIAGSADVYAQMSKLLHSAPNKEMRDDVVERMTRLGVPPTLPAYNNLINKSGTYEDAVDWFDRLKDKGLVPDEFTYSILINLSPDIKTATVWFDAMVEAGVRPNEVTYSTLINLSPDLETATVWFDAMREAGVRPNEVTYNTHINLSPDHETATGWFDAMREAGVRPDEVTYNTLIKLSPDLETAKVWFDAMREAGVRPDEFTYSTLINLSPDLEAATVWFDAMREAGVRPNEVTYSTLINLSPDLETATVWFDAIREAGVRPDEVTMSSLAKKIKHPDDADRLTKFFLDAEIFIGEGYYAAIYSLLSQHLDAEELLAWYARQRFRDPRALNAAIAGFARSGKIEDACRVALSFPYLDSAWKIYREDQEIAIAYYSRLLAEEFEPHNAVYALGYCFKENGRYEEALEMFNQALSMSKHEKRTENIQKQISEIHQALGKT